jgi:hypothetical protein
MKKIYDKYKELCNTTSDINELLPFLNKYAKESKHITEMGVRRPTSTYAFLAGCPERLVSYDIGRYPEVDEVEQLCKDSEIDFTFHLQDVLKCEIEETDFLFIDTYHTYTQLTRELALHAGKVKKFIAFHDTTTFGAIGELSYESVAGNSVNCGRGIWKAIEEFLANNPNWTLDFKTEINNGLTVIRKIK